MEINCRDTENHCQSTTFWWEAARNERFKRTKRVWWSGSAFEADTPALNHLWFSPAVWPHFLNLQKENGDSIRVISLLWELKEAKLTKAGSSVPDPRWTLPCLQGNYEHSNSRKQQKNREFFTVHARHPGVENYGKFENRKERQWYCCWWGRNQRCLALRKNIVTERSNWGQTRAIQV